MNQKLLLALIALMFAEAEKKVTALATASGIDENDYRNSLQDLETAAITAASTASNTHAAKLALAVENTTITRPAAKTAVQDFFATVTSGNTTLADLANEIVPAATDNYATMFKTARANAAAAAVEFNMKDFTTAFNGKHFVYTSRNGTEAPVYLSAEDVPPTENGLLGEIVSIGFTISKNADPPNGAGFSGIVITAQYVNSNTNRVEEITVPADPTNFFTAMLTSIIQAGKVNPKNTDAIATLTTAAANCNPFVKDQNSSEKILNELNRMITAGQIPNKLVFTDLIVNITIRTQTENNTWTLNVNSPTENRNALSSNVATKVADLVKNFSRTEGYTTPPKTVYVLHTQLKSSKTSTYTCVGIGVAPLNSVLVLRNQREALSTLATETMLKTAEREAHTANRNAVMIEIQNAYNTHVRNNMQMKVIAAALKAVYNFDNDSNVAAFIDALCTVNAE